MNKEKLQEYTDYANILRERISLGEKVNRLKQIPEFKSLILDGYCINKSAEFLANYANTELDTNIRESSLEAAKACGYLNCYLNTICIRANQAKEQLPEVETAISILENGGNLDE